MKTFPQPFSEMREEKKVKVLKYFYKKGFGKRVLSMTMAFLMLFTMFAGQLPAGLLEVKAATIASPEVVGNEVTFRYENSGASSVALAGTMNGWSTTATQMTKGNDGVWTHTATLEDGIYQYKFVVNGNSWKQDPKNPNGLCGDNSVVAVNVPLATSVDGLDVTFRYYNPDASKVCLAGTMNGWSSTATPMTKNEYGVWTITQTLTAGSHEYKFVVGSDWHTDPNNSLKASNGNSLITVVDETAPEIISPEVNGKEVTFRYYSKAASTVQLAGGMTEWGTNPIPMTETDNIFETTVELTPGSYQYKFIVDGSWIIDPENEKVFTEPSGNQNSLAIVAGLLDGTATVVKGEETVLSVSRYNEDETTSVATGVTFALAEDTYASDVAIDGDKITVSKDCEATELVVNATLGEETAKLTLTLGEAEITTFDVTLHIYNADGWSQMALYAWNHASFSGYSSWPGKQILTNETLKAGEWYEYTVKDVEAGAGKLIINNNDNGKQTLDLDFTVSAEQNELWVVAGDKGGLNPGLVVYSEDDVVINEPSAGFDVTLHIYNADGWSQMALYAWNHASFSGYSSWPGKQLFAGQTLATGEWYEYTVEGVEAGVGKLIINNNNNGKQTKDLDFSISANQNELWVVAGDKGGLNPGAVFYSEDDVVINTPESATEYKVTAHFYNEDNWSKVNAYAKEGTSTNWSNIMGFEAYGEWPGKEISENAEHDNWYDLTITKYGDADVLVIYNNGSSQTDDLVLTIDGEENEYWYTKAGLVTTAPDAWTNAGGTGPVVPADDDVTLHIYNADGWNKMALYAWDDAQNKLLGAWPGKQILADQTLADDTWYDYTLEGFEPGKVNLIVNNNGSGKQTNDLVFNITETAKEFWVVAASVGGVYNSKAEAEEALSEKIVSPEVNGFEVTFRYIDPSATKVNLAGTMNGWSQTATPMTKDSKGVWSVTLTLAAGTHQYKFVVNNGAAWVTDPSNSAALVDGNSVVSVENPIEVISPEVDGKNVTFRYYSEVATKVYLAGSMTDWANGKKEMTETDDLFEITVELEKGAHEYKFIYATAESAENWTTDPSNTMSANGNSVVYVPGLLDTTASVVRGEATEISATQKYLNLDGSKSDVAVTYTLADAALADVVTIDGNKITVKADSDLESFKLTATTEADDTAVVVVSVAEPGVKPEEVISPEVNGREVTFRYQSDSALEVYLAGSMNGWSGNTTAMTKGEENIFTYTGTYAPGKYQYKFVIGDSWIVDPLNTDKVDDGYGGFNSQFIVSGLCDVADSATKGEVKELPTELVYYNTKGETSKVPVTYTVTETADLAYVTLDGNKLTVAGNCSKASITLTATATVGGKEVTAKVDVAVYDKQYTYTIYAYSENADRMTVDAAALWIWDKAKETSTPDAEYEFTGTEELSDGKTWLKAEVTVGFSKELGIIFRSKGGWTWQTSDLIFENTEKKDCTLYIVEGKGKIYTSLDDIYNEPEEAYRYLVVEYTRDDNDYSDTNVYTWANGLAENTQGYPFEEVNGKYIAKVPVVYSETEMNVGFIVRKGNDWSYAVKDGGDNFAAFPANQEVVKVKFHDAKVTSQYPYNMGGAINRSANAVSFYYRDDAAFLADTLASLAGKVQVVVKSSTGNADIDGTHTMTYDEANGRFTYNVPLTDDTDYCYYYLVDGAKVLDAYNEKKITIADEEYSIIRNKTYQVNMTASVKNDAMDYNDNNLLYVAWEPKAGASLDGFVVTELYADLSELGLGKVAIDPELKALSIACDDSVPAGTKTITVTLVDDCDSSHQATATVKVTERTKKANTEEKLGDFDWDEAVIYFAVTDRFYDGNTANNTLVDAADTTDGSRYHGGDLAGLTAKIDYLYDLGINTIWLTPIVDNIDQNVRDAEDNTDGQESYGYHGYWASDFEALNPHLGTEAELKALVELHMLRA